jgi:hypothetical protein
MTLAPDDLAAIKARLKKGATNLLAINRPNEAQTEKVFIYPVLEALGWSIVEFQQNAVGEGA